jgi:hypothetical protein
MLFHESLETVDVIFNDAVTESHFDSPFKNNWLNTVKNFLFS